MPRWARASKLVRTTPDSLGTTYEFQLKHAPFPFKGAPYKDNTVLVFVPTGFKAAATVDVVWFFHGNDNTALSAYGRHKPHHHLARSKKNAILVAPQAAVMAHDSRAGKLETSNGFSRLSLEIFEELASLKVVPEGARSGTVVLSGHSGGFQPAAKSADIGGVEVHEMYFFDAMYGFSRRVANWIAGDPNRRFVSWYAGRLPTKWTTDLQRRLKRKRIDYRDLRRDAELTDDILSGHRLVFIRTQTPHSKVTQNLERCLRSSRLTDRVPLETANDSLNAPSR
ncbi:MAG: hypothetical protein ACI9OJ_003822 [Myxococcota bacterium]|jgi:hypothetical protein